MIRYFDSCYIQKGRRQVYVQHYVIDSELEEFKLIQINLDSNNDQIRIELTCDPPVVSGPSRKKVPSHQTRKAWLSP